MYEGKSLLISLGLSFLNEGLELVLYNVPSGSDSMNLASPVKLS